VRATRAPDKAPHFAAIRRTSSPHQNMDATKEQIDRFVETGLQRLQELRANGERWLREIAPAGARYLVLQKAGDPVAARVLTHLEAQSRAVGHLLTAEGEELAVTASSVLQEILLRAAKVI
jgi:hypothetical protein